MQKNLHYFEVGAVKTFAEHSKTLACFNGLWSGLDHTLSKWMNYVCAQVENKKENQKAKCRTLNFSS